MTNGGSIEIEGLDRLQKSFDRLGPGVFRAAMDGLKAGAMRIINSAKQNLRENTSVVTGLLRSSGRVEQSRSDNGELNVGFFDTTNRSGYALYVENGRRAGKMPPPDEMEEYAYKKLRIRDRKEARAAGWALAIRIAREGTEPHPFFGPAVEKHKRDCAKDVQAAVNRYVKNIKP